MTLTEFQAIKVGDKVKAGYKARVRTITYVYDDPCGARILSTSAIKGCTKRVTNLDWNDDDHYSKWRVA